MGARVEITRCPTRALSLLARLYQLKSAYPSDRRGQTAMPKKLFQDLEHWFQRGKIAPSARRGNARRGFRSHDARNRERRDQTSLDKGAEYLSIEGPSITKGATIAS
jgi:hypothetical protein